MKSSQKSCKHLLRVVLSIVVLIVFTLIDVPHCQADWNDCSKAKAIILTVDGLNFPKTLLPQALHGAWEKINQDATRGYLKKNLLLTLRNQGIWTACVVDYPWEGDAKDTIALVSGLTGEIKKLSAQAKEQRAKFIIVSHSWGTVLAYMSLLNNIDSNVEVDLLITLSSPLGTQHARSGEMTVLEQKINDFTQKYLKKLHHDQAPKVCLNQVKKWVNFCAWEDMISGPLAKSTEITHLGPITDIWIDSDPATFAGYNKDALKALDLVRVLNTPYCHVITGLGDNFSQNEKMDQNTKESFDRLSKKVKTYVVSYIRPLAVTMSEYKGGFSTQFTDGSDKWLVVRGDWRISQGNYICQGSAKRQLASIAYPVRYGDFDYSVRIKRTGLLNWANGLFFRGDPGLLGNKSSWASAYYFAYINKGSFIIVKFIDKKVKYMKRWTKASAIKKSDWNTLRIRAEGQSIGFYINGQQVWHLKNSSLSVGQVGILGANVTGVKDRLLVDWAKLDLLGGKALPVVKQSYSVPRDAKGIFQAEDILQYIMLPTTEPRQEQSQPKEVQPEQGGRDYFQPR